MLARPSRYNQLSPLNRHQIISCTLYRPGCTVYNVYSVEGQNHSFLTHSEHSIPFMSRTIHSYSGRDYAFLYSKTIHSYTNYGHSFIPIQACTSCHSFLYKQFITSQIRTTNPNHYRTSQVRRLHTFTDQDHSKTRTVYSYTDQDIHIFLYHNH